MFNDKQKIEDDFQGFGSEENQRLCEFSFNYLQELMVNYANAQKAILDNKRDENNLGSEEQEAKKAAKLKEAQDTVEKLNDHLYNTMIKACEILKDNMKMLAKLMTASEFPDYDENEIKSVFTKLDTLLTGKFSILKAIMILAMSIQLYEVGSTDLDEVS